MEFTNFVRKPFVVEAVEVTEENIAEIAELLGELKQKPNGSPYILVGKKGQNVYKVYPGYWVTKMNDNIRWYSKKIFSDQFTPLTPELEKLVGNGHQAVQEVPQPEVVDA